MKIKLFVNIGTVVAFALAVTALFSACKPAGKAPDNGPHRIKVVSTLFPLYDMAKKVGAEIVTGDKKLVSGRAVFIP